MYSVLMLAFMHFLFWPFNLVYGIKFSCLTTICSLRACFSSEQYVHKLGVNTLTITPFSCPSRITRNCLTQLWADISWWPNILLNLHFHKPPSHVHHLDKRWDRALWWQHPLLVSVTDQQRICHVCEHSDSNRETPRTLRMPCHHWRMGESANLHTKCQKEYNSERSVVSELMPLGFSQGVLCIRYSMHTFCMWGGENI